MKLRERLFGKTDKQRRVSEKRMSPLLQAMAAEIPRWPPQDQRILERVIIEARAAGVSSMEDFSVFMNSHPDLRAGYDKVMSRALGREGHEVVPPMEPLETMGPTRVTNPSLGMQDLNISDPEEMRAYLEEQPENAIKLSSHILEQAKISGDRMAEVVALGELGLAHARLNQLPKAIYYFERHLEISRELGNWEWEMEDYRNLGRAYVELGENARALSIYEDALTLARQRDERQWIINHSLSLASVHAALGNVQRAAELTNKAKALANKAGR